MAHVLLPTDLSANALNAACYAVRLFGTEGNQYTLLHVLAPTLSMEAADVGTDLLLAQSAKEGLADFAARLTTALAGMKPTVATAIEHGMLAQVVHHFVNGYGPAELVVMGTQGASGLQEVLIGSNTADVIKHGGLPVLAVPHACTYKAPKRILLAEDAGPVDKATLRPLLEIARSAHAEVAIVRVVKDGAPTEHGTGDDTYDLLMGAIPHTHAYLRGDAVDQALNDLADQGDTDLLVVIHRHRGLFEGLFHRSTSARLVMHSHVPLLVLHQRAH